MRRSVPALSALLLMVCTLFPGEAPAAPGDTTWVRTFDAEFLNWATPHYGTFTLPPEPANWQKVVLFLTIECPDAPGDCDPWDRLGHVRVVTPDQGDVELARFVTPYDITIPGGPGSCTWTHNVTHDKVLLQDEVELRLYVESWIGGDRGWLLTIDFAFIEGELALEPYRVVNLWQDDWVEYGNPDDPLEDSILPVTLDVPADAEKVEVRVYATGHGQGNTINCAEFCSRQHSVVADGTAFSHFLWRANCGTNTCSPQGGSWEYERAGWCPGSAARPWKVDVTGAVTPGQPATLEYLVTPYENDCRPGNPDCVSGSTCPDCDYNSTGHTPPIYVIQSQAIFYKSRSAVVGATVGSPRAGDGLRLGPNAPNPFDPRTSFEYTVPRPSDVRITIHDPGGRVVHEETRRHATAGTHRVHWDGRDDSGRAVAAGAYFYTIRVDDEIRSRKMIRLR